MSFEQLVIAVVLLALSGLSTWIQKRRQAREETRPARDIEHARGPQPAGQPNPRPVQRQPFDWEEELRRLLEGAQPDQPERRAERPPPVSAPPFPPIITVGRPPASPTPPPLAPAPARSTLPRPAPTVLPVEPEPGYTETEELAAREMGRLPQSAKTWTAASQLAEAAAARLQAADEATQRHTASSAAHRRAGTAPVFDPRQFRNPQAVRQAIIASVILGPPQALAPQEN